MMSALTAVVPEPGGIRSLGRRILGQSPAAPRYRVGLARTGEEIRAAQALRFRVFNLEMGGGLDSALLSGRDEDPFDAVCDHLIVEDLLGGGVVGTYRLQPGDRAEAGLGFYSAQEFDLAPFRERAREVVELGRACIDGAHRNRVVLGLLWRGVCDYGRAMGARYFIGCSSLTSRDPAVGAAAYLELGPRCLVDSGFRTHPLPAYACPLDVVASPPPAIPKLLRAYLSLGARICGAPAIDREFGTIDFLTVLDRTLLEGV